MNVLILTPDRVGSTLLQRLLTIYMLNKGFDKPVINLHELTNGLEKYYHPKLNKEVLGKPKTEWSYYQSLPEIVQLLDSVDHYKTSRLAHYHIERRKDSIADQLKFYDYLNENFYIISCLRDNLFEHAISWEIVAHSKQLNVYNIGSKVDAFEDIYKNGIRASEISFKEHLDRYKRYIDWTKTYFNVQSYFNYDLNIQNIEDYIINLDFMSSSNRSNNSWEHIFGQDFNTWNLCHRLLPNLFIREKLKNTTRDKVLTFFHKSGSWSKIKGDDWPELPSQYDSQKNHLPSVIKKEILSLMDPVKLNLTEIEYNFLKNNVYNYMCTSDQISQLTNDGYLVSGVPIKLQSLAEKQSILKNFEECIVWYNDWVSKNNYGPDYTSLQLQHLSDAEESFFSTNLVQLKS